MSTTNRDHILIFPFMAKGHTIPLLHLCAYLSSAHRDLSITLVTTPANSAFIHHQLPSHLHPNISVRSLPFPSFRSLPRGVESTDTLPSPSLYPTFLKATTLLETPFRQLLLSLPSPPPLCLISDFFLGWTLSVANEFNIPRLVFHGMSAFSMSLCKSFFLNLPENDHPFRVPGLPPSLLFTRSDIPETILNMVNQEDPVTQFLMNDVGLTDIQSSGILVNSFAHVDQDYVALLESFYTSGARAWVVGPLSLLAGLHATEDVTDEEGCLAWLDEKKNDSDSVVYVSFGTQTYVADEQLDEVAHGLVSSGHPFLWAVRSKTWSPPESLLSEIQSRGKIVKGWVPQNEVLAHVAVGGFVSHCGWNSVLESLSAGVPMVCWAMIAEQPLNAKHVAEVLGVGVKLDVKGGEIIRRDELKRRVREVMGGKRFKQRADELRRAAEEAMAEGGSSHVALGQLLDELRKARGNNVAGACESCLSGELNETPAMPMQVATRQNGVPIV